jgi:uncharacterized protein
VIATSEIREFVDRVARDFLPERVILFGSHASGTPRPESDVDILVILPFDGKPFWKSLEIINRENPSFPIDLLVRSPDDTRRRYAQGDPLIREALDQGIVLYERSC